VRKEAAKPYGNASFASDPQFLTEATKVRPLYEESGVELLEHNVNQEATRNDDIAVALSVSSSDIVPDDDSDCGGSDGANASDYTTHLNSPFRRPSRASLTLEEFPASAMGVSGKVYGPTRFS
jgi:hypothetical protein